MNDYTDRQFYTNIFILLVFAIGLIYLGVS